jgi:hypothetical protein
MACNLVSRERTLIVVRPISGELGGGGGSCVDNAEATSWRPSLGDSKNSCHKMADNTGHGLIPTEQNSSYRDKINGSVVIQTVEGSSVGFLLMHPITRHEGSEGVKMGVCCQRNATPALPPEKRQEAGWALGPVWTGAENLSPTRIRSPDRPAHSESLYRLRYRGLLCLSEGNKERTVTCFLTKARYYVGLLLPQKMASIEFQYIWYESVLSPVDVFRAVVPRRVRWPGVYFEGGRMHSVCQCSVGEVT